MFIAHCQTFFHTFCLLLIRIISYSWLAVEFVCSKSTSQQRAHNMSVTESNPTNSNIKTQSSEVESSLNLNIVKLESNQSIEEPKPAMPEVKQSLRRKMFKKEQKKRFNARIRRLICPKSPLKVFSELYSDVPIKLEAQMRGNFVIFIASIMIDDQLYTGDHVSKTQAKEIACEKFLRKMLSNEICQTSRACSEEVASTAENSKEVDGTGNTNSVKPKESSQDFPWLHFNSLAMHNLLSNWNLKSVSTQISAMKKFPANPEKYHPVDLLYQMSPGIKFNEAYVLNSRLHFEASCEINGVTFKSQGATKKEAKRESAIAAIKHFWSFDYHSSEKK
ncbi:Double-stranded RNA-binding domain [Cinara cedri]|uniref:Double-stranded RNA-binding domain n=1 Tax=Cinara cedri TaxID=506608 RepID=A0A5E4NMD2_9HEMI|nr:Double-stranded RNA-binding domain [Cinara cedri]